MKLNKKIALGSIALAGAFALTACNDTPQSNANSTEASQAAAGQTNLVTAQPVHAYSYSQIRENIQEIEDAEAKGAISTSFFFQKNSANKDPYLVCQSLGAPLSSTDQLTNPLQAVEASNSSSYALTSIGQMENTGIYTGTTGEGTWVLCIGADGSIIPNYAEPDVHSVFAPAHWDYTKHTIVVDGPASFKMSLPK